MVLYNMIKYEVIFYYNNKKMKSLIKKSGLESDFQNIDMVVSYVIISKLKSQ